MPSKGVAQRQEALPDLPSRRSFLGAEILGGALDKECIYVYIVFVLSSMELAEVATYHAFKA